MARISWNNLWNSARTHATNALSWARETGSQFAGQFGSWDDIVRSIKDRATFSSTAQTSRNATGGVTYNQWGIPSNVTQQTSTWWTQAKNFFAGLFGGGGGGGTPTQAASQSGGFLRKIGGKGTLIGAAISLVIGAVDGVKEANFEAKKEGFGLFKWLGTFTNRFLRSSVVGLASVIAGGIAVGALALTGFPALLVGLGVSALAGWLGNRLINSNWPTPTRDEMRLEATRQQKAREAKENAKKLVDEDKMLIHMDPDLILKEQNFDEVEQFLDASVYRVNNGNFVPIFDDRSRPSPFSAVKFSES